MSESAPRSSPPPPECSPPTTPTDHARPPPDRTSTRLASSTSTDTIYITAPAHKQALCAPLVVGLLEQIRHATYEEARRNGAAGPPLFFCLDEVANIAPIHDLPALVSEAGGQRLHVMACLQDLSQARNRWGEAAADGFLSLFQTKLILTGIADSRTLEAISLALGEYDRKLVSYTLGRSRSELLRAPSNHRERHLPHPAPPDPATRGNRTAAERPRTPVARDPLGTAAADALVSDRALGERRSRGAWSLESRDVADRAR